LNNNNNNNNSVEENCSHYRDTTAKRKLLSMGIEITEQIDYLLDIKSYAQLNIISE
jgi:hypothetical protein